MLNSLRYPRALQPGDTIGVTAPSGGVGTAVMPRLDLALGHLVTRGFRLREGACLRRDHKHVSADRESRAREFMDFWLDPGIAAIIPPWGGELVIDLLPLIDFARLGSAEPTWLMGYSDISTLLFPLTLLADVATAHGTNLMDSIPGQSDPLSTHCLDPLCRAPGESVEQVSSHHHQDHWVDFTEDPGRGFNLTSPTRWKALGGNDDRQVAIRGRMIGGSLDTLACLVGTRFGNLPDFTRQHRRDGVILYLENAELAPPAVFRHLTQMRMAGWFEGLSGLVLGRSAAGAPDAHDDLTYREAVEQALGDLALPVILDADIGHVPPQMTILNGALAEIFAGDGRGRLIQTLAP